MAGLGATHPEMVRRWNKLVELCWARGWECWISSSTRSRATQADLYSRWLRGLYRVPAVANPNSDGGLSPWGWRWRGSKHMPQADGHSHALDVGHRGCTDAQFEQLAVSCGLVRTVRNEFWHRQWANRQTIFDAPALTAPTSFPLLSKGKRMFIWICRQNNGEEVPYLWDGEKVESLHNITTVDGVPMAFELLKAGVPGGGRLDEDHHTRLLRRLTGQPDLHGAVGVWD